MDLLAPRSMTCAACSRRWRIMASFWSMAALSRGFFPMSWQMCHGNNQWQWCEESSSPYIQLIWRWGISAPTILENLAPPGSIACPPGPPQLRRRFPPHKCCRHSPVVSLVRGQVAWRGEWILNDGTNNTMDTNFVIVMSHGHWPASNLAITEACGVDVLLFLPSLSKTKKWKWIRDAQWAYEAACDSKLDMWFVNS